MTRKKSKLDQEALAFHANGRPGKLEITATKPLMSQHDLSLAYSPGVAVPCLEIAEDPDTAYDYTAKGNLVAVLADLKKAKPAAAKGVYFRKITLSTTMGPGVTIDHAALDI